MKEAAGMKDNELLNKFQLEPLPHYRAEILKRMAQRATGSREVAERITQDLIHCGIILSDEHTRAMEQTIASRQSAPAGGERPWKRQESCPECDGDGCAACQPEPPQGAGEPRCANPDCRHTKSAHRFENSAWGDICTNCRCNQWIEPSAPDDTRAGTAFNDLTIRGASAPPQEGK